MLLCLMEDFIVTAASAILILTGERFLLSLFNIGYSRLVIIFTAYIFSLLYDVMSGYLRGFGISFVPALLTTVGVCGTRILWVYTVFSGNRTFQTLMLVYPVSLSVTAVLILFALLYYHKTRLSTL